jgi:hypothetical protein
MISDDEKDHFDLISLTQSTGSPQSPQAKKQARVSRRIKPRIIENVYLHIKTVILLLNGVRVINILTREQLFNRKFPIEKFFVWL